MSVQIVRKKTLLATERIFVVKTITILDTTHRK
jgi:hypothetical protein